MKCIRAVGVNLLKFSNLFLLWMCRSTTKNTTEFSQGSQGHGEKASGCCVYHLGGISTERGRLLCGRMSAIAGNHQCERTRVSERDRNTEKDRESASKTTTTQNLHNNPQYEVGAHQQPASVYTLILYYRDIHMYLQTDPILYIEWWGTRRHCGRCCDAYRFVYVY